LDEFKFNDKIEGKEEITQSIDDIYSAIESWINEKDMKLQNKKFENEEFRKKVADLPKVKKLEVWKKYKWLVDGVLNNMVYVRLDSDHRWVIHKKRIGAEVFKLNFKWENKPNRWDEIEVELLELSQGNEKLQFFVK
jgi:hypothetical protein